MVVEEVGEGGARWGVVVVLGEGEEIIPPRYPLPKSLVQREDHGSSEKPEETGSHTSS